jgi:hypothetical protein
MCRRTAYAVLVMCFFLPLGAVGTATASTGDIIAPSDPLAPAVDSGWQAGTCKEEPPESADYCSVDTPDQFFRTAAGHPEWGFTQFIVKHTTEEPLPGTKLERPVDEVATIRVDLPVGLSVNPSATERCPLAVFEAGAEGCRTGFPGSEVGESLVTTSLAGVVSEPTAPLTKVPVYNVIPVFGEAARFGLELGGKEVFLRGDVAWSSDYHEGFTIDVPKALPVGGLVLKNRLVFEGRSGNGTFLTTPSTCLGEAFPWGPAGHVYSTWLLAQSWKEKEEEAGGDYSFPADAEPAFESPIPEGAEPEECESMPYDPAIDMHPGTGLTNSPAGATVDIDIPEVLPDYLGGEDEQATSTTKTSTVTLPLGMGLNPSAANGLQVCSDAEFGKGTRNPLACPAASRIGMVEIESPPLVEENDEGAPLKGPIYVGKQLSRDPMSGNEYRIFINAVSSRYGVDVRLVGNVKADPQTGQLATTIAGTPQVPVTSFEVHFDGGARAVLSSPPTCGPNKGGAVMVPWSEPWAHDTATPSSSFTLSNNPAGGKCPKTLAERPFSPGFAAGPASSKAGAFSPVSLQISRPDGQQELKGTEVLLPPGMTGKLRGIPYCPEDALATAATRSGAEEKAASSCPAASQVGTAAVAAGTGPSPLRIDGKVFLSGPYHGAPLSLGVVTPATAGPYDLGTVVVRVALFVDPETAQIRAVADPIPHLFGGTLLSIRSVDLKMDRPDFTLNPTSCEPFAISGALRGGGGDPNNPAAFSAFGVSVPFQASDCDKLDFAPKLFTKLIGGRKKMRRNGHPAFQATLLARPGDANIRRTALKLPRSQFLDQSHIGTVCTRVQLAAADCPARSVYGFAWAESPLLDEKVEGPVYLVSSDHELPDLLADLHGQVNVRLRGVISSSKQRMKTVFSGVPDVPVSKFVLKMQGGSKSLLVNSKNLCGRRNRSFLSFEGQNGKVLKVKKLPLQTPSCRKAKHKHRHSGSD